MSNPRPLWLIAAPAIFLLLWSAGFAVAKIGLEYTDPMTLLSLRYACVVVIMAVLFAVLRPPLPKSPTDWAHLALVGFLLQAVYFGMCYLGFRAGIAAGTMALIMSLQPVLVALIAPRWTGSNVGRAGWIGLGLGLLGTGLVIASRTAIEAPGALAFLYTAIALVGITGASLWEKRFGLSHHPVTANLIGYGAGLLGVLPLMLALEPMQIDWTWQFSAALAYLVLANSLIAIGLLLAMIRAGDVARVSALFFLVPPLTALIAWGLLGEVMTPLAWAGIAMAGAGVWLATRKSQVKKTFAPECQ